MKGFQVWDTLCLAPVWHFNFHFRGTHPTRWPWSLLRIPVTLSMALISLMNLYKRGDPISAPLNITPETFHGSILLLSDWHLRFSVCFIEMLYQIYVFLHFLLASDLSSQFSSMSLEEQKILNCKIPLSPVLPLRFLFGVLSEKSLPSTQWQGFSSCVLFDIYRLIFIFLHL